ncbi:MAG: hypothetical protein KIS67_01500 [Verrucomicrobiae bacterium]|nr:hypothetical protein [Verrucomicrobiae bacterium]
MDIDSCMLNGSDEEVEAVMQSDDVPGVDHRSLEEETLRGFARFLPGLSWKATMDSEGQCHVDLFFDGRKLSRCYENIPHNCFRVVRDINDLISPKYSIRVYAPTMGDDTHTFVVRPTRFWRRFDSSASPERKALFQDIDFLNEAWGLSQSIARVSGFSLFWRKHVRHLIIGELIGLSVATVCSIIAFGISLLTNTWYFEKLHASTWKIVGTYFVGFAVASVPVGLLLPYARHLIVAVLVGILGGITVYTAVGYSMGEVNYFIGVPLGTMIGSAVAVILWREVQRCS